MSEKSAPNESVEMKSDPKDSPTKSKKAGGLAGVVAGETAICDRWQRRRRIKLSRLFDR